jgi:uncharacterized protein
MVPSQVGLNCIACERPLRPGAIFCTNCGYTVEASSALPVRTEEESHGTNFASQWNEIKLTGLLFGLLLFDSFMLGMVSRSYSSPWPETILSGINAAIILIFAGVRYRAVKPLLCLPRLSACAVLELVGLVIACFAVITGYFMLIQRMDIPTVHLAVPYQQAGWNVATMFLLVSLMPAVFEELAFRGVIQSALENIFNAREACIIQAALFSVLHLLPMIFPSHFLMGLCFGILRLRSKSLYPGMAVHATWNALVLLEEIYR